MTGFQQRAWQPKYEGTRVQCGDLGHTNEDSDMTESKPLKKRKKRKEKPQRL